MVELSEESGLQTEQSVEPEYIWHYRDNRYVLDEFPQTLRSLEKMANTMIAIYENDRGRKMALGAIQPSWYKVFCIKKGAQGKSFTKLAVQDELILRSLARYSHLTFEVKRTENFGDNGNSSRSSSLLEIAENASSQEASSV